MKTVLTTAALLLLASPVAAQPYSESMADCASIYQNAAQWAPSDQLADQLMYAARQWHAAALDQLHREGQALSETAVWEKVDAKTAVWESRGAVFLLSEEYFDWVGYCRSFAGHVNVAYQPPSETNGTRTVSAGFLRAIGI